MIGSSLVRSIAGQVDAVKAAVLAVLAASNGAGLVGFIQAAAGAVARSLLAKVRELHLSVMDFGAVGDNATDDRAAIQAAIDAVAAAGGGTVVFPRCAGYSISGAIVVSSSNITLELHADVKLTRTAATDGDPHNAIRVQGTTAAYLDNVAVVAPTRRVKVDCNGRNVAGYVHATGKNHHGVFVQFARNIRLKNIYSYNGLVGGITTSYCLGGVIEDCDASDSVYDNGIYCFSNGEHVAPFSDTDPSTWSNIRMVRPRAWSCPNHGVGIFGAVGVTIDSPKVWSCGNNTGVAIAGPAGGVGVEFDTVNAARDYRCTIINPSVVGSWGFGIRTNCRGTRVIGGRVVGTKIPTAYTDGAGAGAIWGSGVFVQSGATDCDIECDISGSERYGLRLAGNAPNYPGTRFRGSISGTGKQGIFGTGVGLLELDPTCTFTGNGDPTNTLTGDQHTVEINNTASNPNGGALVAAGRFDGNQGGCVKSSGVATVDLTRGITGKDNGVAWATANHMVYVPSCVDLRAATILLTNTIGKQARVLKCDGATRAVVDRMSIQGDQTNVNAPKADVTATAFVGEMVGTATFDPVNLLANSWGPTTDVTVTGARSGDVVTVAFQANAKVMWLGSVSANDTVTIVPYNPTASAVDFGSGNARVLVRRPYGA